MRTALEVARALGPRRVCASTRRDRSSTARWDELGEFDPRGVNAELVWKVRYALDEHGFERVKIVASGGFDAERITAFEESGVPVDSYGVGSAFLRGENDYTGDVVLTDGQPSGKVGRAKPFPPRACYVSCFSASGVPPIGAAWTPSSTSWRTSPRSP